MPDSRVPRATAATVAKIATYTFEAVSLAALAYWAVRRWLLPAVPEKEKVWDDRRFWTAINVGNHGIYAILFVIRSTFYADLGGNDRPFYYESYFLGYLCGPAAVLPILLGWDNKQYNQSAVLKWMTTMNAAGSTAFPSWITACISSPLFMYVYQIAEGTFHFMIVIGGLRAFFQKAWPPKEGDKSLSLFRWGLWLEILLMDITYVIAHTCLPMLSCPGHWGLTTIMMVIHHLNVLPDIVCACHEWTPSRSASKQAVLRTA